ncbi:MAG: HAD-IA family hydrolase [Emcibacteraceae bacterium]|nr:HAD-IA family hydrolase [Emcibacteraceae bacterium]
MFKNKPSAILFDLDGTIADSALDLSASLNYLLDVAGRDEIDPSLIRNMVGQGARALIVKGFTHTGETPNDQEIDALLDQYLKYYLDNIADKTVLFPGVLDLIKKLTAEKIPLAVCTNKNIVLTHALLEEMNINHYFSAVSCGDSFPFRKPDPRHLIATCELMKAGTDNAIMVGDSINDITPAKAANFLSVGVTFGYSKIPMSELGADIVIDHFDDFITAINSFTPQT